MKLGGRIAVYVFLFAVECGLFAVLNPWTEERQKAYQLELEFNREVIQHRTTMQHLNAVYDCLKRFPSLGNDGCENAVDEREAKKEARRLREIK